MSHFCGLVIMTPDYLKNHDLEDALSNYDESLKVPEYSLGEVSNLDKISFINYYTPEVKDKEEKLKEEFAESVSGKEGYMTFDEYCKGWNGDNRGRYLYHLVKDHQEDYVKFWLNKFPELFAKFDELYKEHGEDWNGSRWRINHLSGKWEEYSEYNPDSKWDWYTEGGRWAESIKTKSGEFVDACLLNEIDWSEFKPEDYEDKEKESWDGTKYKPLKEDVKYHYTKSAPPFCLVVDGEWIERGQMGWWAFVSNEKDKDDWAAEFAAIIAKLPEDSEVVNVDFHI